MARRRTAALLLAAGLALSACQSHPRAHLQSCTAGTPAPPIVEAADGRRQTELSVLIYNVEGLPWPARSNRSWALREIAGQLAAMRRRGEAPDVVMLQEAFKPRAGFIGRDAGYENWAQGPRARDPAAPPSPDAAPEFLAGRRFLKGERSPKLLSSGLYILSDYPILEVHRRPFRRHECAGYDCLANKGVMLARIAIPGVPAPVDLLTTHMNSRVASGASPPRSLEAHRLQTLEIARFLAETRGEQNPLIFGGDFNMRRSSDRLEHFTYHQPHAIVSQYCTLPSSDCDVRVSWDGDEPWLDTQDLQGFAASERVDVRPIRVEALFDEPAANGRRLADHDGYLVTYRLSWDAEVAPGPGVCPPAAALRD